MGSVIGMWGLWVWKRSLRRRADSTAFALVLHVRSRSGMSSVTETSDLSMPVMVD